MFADYYVQISSFLHLIILLVFFIVNFNTLMISIICGTLLQSFRFINLHIITIKTSTVLTYLLYKRKCQYY